MIRAFVALPLPADVRQRLAALTPMLPLRRCLPPESLHLTLAFLGELPEPAVEEAHYALEVVTAPSFSLSLRGIGTFGGDRPRLVYAGVAPEPALDRLHARVLTALRRAGLDPAARRFVPHVTLARLKPGEVDLPRLEHAILDHAGFAAGPWEADRFALYRAHLGRGGAQYEELAAYPLR